METPKHYETLQPQPIEIAENWNLPFSLGCTIKYIGRYREKNDPIGDLRKAAWYIDREIKRLERMCGD